MRTVIGIDPGASGAISVSSNGRVASAKMPDTVYKMREYLTYLRETYPDALVFIEKVQAYVADDEAPGKKFAINKMLKNYNELLTVIRLTPLPFVEVAPVTWQSALALRSAKGTPKAIRKTNYKNFAQAGFPQLKVNLATADSLCLVLFGQQKILTSPAWVSEKTQNETKSGLF